MKTKNPGKQRKSLNQNRIKTNLSKELRQKHNKRSVRVRVGDKVKVVRGQFRGKTGKIDRINAKKAKVYVTGIETSKKDGSKVLLPIHSTNLMIQELNLVDKRRLKK